MAKDFPGEASEIRSASVAAVRWVLGLRQHGWSKFERQTLANLAPALARIIRAKAAPDECRYIHLLQRHPRLHQAILKLGSTPARRASMNVSG